MQTWINCKYITDITPQMNFVFQLLQNKKDNEGMIKVLNCSINYCDNKTLNSLKHNKHRLFQKDKFKVFVNYNGWSNNIYKDFSKNKGPLVKLTLFSVEEFSYYEPFNQHIPKKYITDKSVFLTQASYYSAGIYRLYKNQIYKLCNKT